MTPARRHAPLAALRDIFGKKRDPFERAIRNIKIATFNVIVAICLAIATIVVILVRHARG
jgi:hypothetical protein